MAKMRILCITGAWCWRHPQPIWKNLAAALQETFPEAAQEIALEEIHFLHPWQFDRMNAFCERTVRKHDTGGKILIVGHSMGGPMGYEIAQRMEHTQIVGVATIFSPNTFLWSVFPRMIDSKLERVERQDIPVVSFQASLDQLVWWGAEHPDVHYHEYVLSDHRFAIQLFPSIAHKIARSIRMSLYPKMLELELECA